MPYTNPSVADFKNYFTRDFPYGIDPNVAITDSDIAKAFTLTNVNINQSLFTQQSDYTTGYLCLSAHYLVQIIRAGSQGVNGQYNFLQQAKGVGSVSESFGIPERILKIPVFAMLAKTNYGSMYLQMLLPQLVGQVGTAHGRTHA